MAVLSCALREAARAGEVVAIAELHNVPTRCQSFSRDGSKLAVGGSNDGIAVVEIFSTGTWEPVAKYSFDRGSVMAVATSTDGKMLFAAVGNEIVAVALSDGKEAGRLSRHTDIVFAIAVSLDGKYLATGGQDGRVCLWDAARLKLVRELGHSVNSIFDVAFDPSSKQLAAVGRDIFRVWPTVEKRHSEDVPFRDSAIAVRFSPKGNLVVAATVSGILVVAKVKEIASPPRAHRLGKHLDGIGFVNSEESIVVGVERDVCVVAIDTGKVIRASHHGDHLVSGIAIDCVNGQLAVGAWNRKIRILRADELTGESGLIPQGPVQE